MSRLIDATKHKGLPFLFERTPRTATIVDNEPVAVGDSLQIYDDRYTIDNIVEQRAPKGDYKEFNGTVTLYKLEIS